MSSDADKGYQTVRSGYLDVKIPADQSERLLHKAWRRLWVCAIVFRPPGRGDPHLILQLIRKKKIFKTIKVPSDGLRLFRCKSSSRSHRTWALSSGDTVVVYLAAGSEAETQAWMRDVRHGLWMPIMATGKEHVHEVSLIDDEKSFSCGLLGVYGDLSMSEENTICLIHPHWQSTQMRWRIQDIIQVKLIRTDVFSLQVRSSDATRTLYFYSDTAESTVSWLNGLSSKEHKKILLETLQVENSTSDPQYGQVNQRKKCSESHDDVTICSERSNLNEDECQVPSPKTSDKLSLRLLNMTGDFLNASMSSLVIQTPDCCQKILESDTESSDEGPYDNIYEEISDRRDSRTDTIYEDIDDNDDEPLPKLTPPPLPNHDRKPNIRDSTAFKQIDRHLQIEVSERPSKNPCSLNTENTSASVKRSSSERLREEVSNCQSNDHCFSTTENTSVSARRPSTLQLMKLSESVEEALKVAEEPMPKPYCSRSSLIRKILGKKSKSNQASPSSETPQHKGKLSVRKRSTSVPDAKDPELLKDVEEALNRRASADVRKHGVITRLTSLS